MSASSRTGASIVAEVNCLLDSGPGQDKIRQLSQLAAKLNCQAGKVRSAMKWAKPRKTASFYFNAAQASRLPLRLSVRTGGVQCGALLLKSPKQRVFQPLNVKRFGVSWDGPPN
jgi:hypothetical protein